MVHEFEMKVKDTPTSLGSPITIPVVGSTVHYVEGCEEHDWVKSVTVAPVDDSVHLEFISETAHIIFDVTMNKEDAFELSAALKGVLAQYGLAD
jgi:hypothetical protein